MAEYYVIRDKNTGLYFRGKGANRWGKHYNQATIYRAKGTAEHSTKEIAWRGEQAEIVPIQIIENPADIVEVIRCKDCKHFIQEEHGCNHFGYYSHTPSEKGKTMYNSPINIIYGQMQTQMGGDILRAVQQYGIDVDKEELIRALQYDRDQYDHGFSDGYMNARQELVKCKDCKHYNVYRLECHNEHMNGYIGIDGFCSYGERKDK